MLLYNYDNLSIPKHYEKKHFSTSFKNLKKVSKNVLSEISVNKLNFNYKIILIITNITTLNSYALSHEKFKDQHKFYNCTRWKVT